MKEISVIIPAYNEENTIKQVIDVIKKSKIKSEIIVVNNCCTDNTETIAKNEGATVVFCKDKGKGYAMEAGVKAASNEIVVFLDADITDYDENIIDILANPLINDKVDLVKSTFERTKGGMVTELATKPLLDILFPEIYKFSEPLSGMIAGKKSILEQLTFEKDYGVDIGILLDVINMNYIVEEVNIGKIENMSHLCKTTETMRNMSIQIMIAILKRANYVK